MSQVLAALPGVKGYGRFLASRPSITFRKRSDKSVRRIMASVAPGELLRAHLVHHDRYARWARKMNFCQFFIYRDPRDVAVSEAHYLSHMNRWHRLHGCFRSLDSMEDRISLAILGDSFVPVALDYPDIATRFARYRGWIHDESAFAVRFEELLPPKLQRISEMVEFYAKVAELEMDSEAVIRDSMANIAPKQSHTFREGGSGGWREDFTERNKEEFKEVAGQLLIELGYESDGCW